MIIILRFYIAFYLSMRYHPKALRIITLALASAATGAEAFQRIPAI